MPGVNFIELLSREKFAKRISLVTSQTFMQNVCTLAGSLFYIALAEIFAEQKSLLSSSVLEPDH